MYRISVLHTKIAYKGFLILKSNFRHDEKREKRIETLRNCISFVSGRKEEYKKKQNKVKKIRLFGYEFMTTKKKKAFKDQ